ncbi:hypothetical protein HDA35_004647 [Micromonospora purpureochromogenes]|uniref:Uncharacterized protein n=1 Tax=Micromonospora purpureochromogenes TaxID=47872 RepID=A0ABX2RRG8_9ACTN|nr:hypothetical protein [Micromonospora purpureochromogenes]
MIGYRRISASFIEVTVERPDRQDRLAGCVTHVLRPICHAGPETRHFDRHFDGMFLPSVD